MDDWRKLRELTPEKLVAARLALEDVRCGLDVVRALRRHPLSNGGYPPKSALVAVYHSLVESGEIPADPTLLARICMKPVRSLSGVTTVTILTRPHPCPGECIFCPDDVRMPKSYLPDEPGAARAFQHGFDPSAQIISRLESYRAVGHPTEKVELLILGGSWTAYPRAYQEDYIHRCFDALNGSQSPTLVAAQQVNETAPSRNVGLVIETRPDHITPATLAWLRHLGVTKVQMGAQSLDDTLLVLNRRGHTTADTLKAAALLRAAGFKIVLHWMPNLLGATPASDRIDFARLWQDYCPDEIKIYPTQLLQGTELHAAWKRGEYEPYDTATLVKLIADIKPTIPRYCRVNRVIRDIPSHHVIAGNRRTSLRQDVLAEVARRGAHCQCVRCREVRGQAVEPSSLHLMDETYPAACAEEHFLQYITPDDQLAGYLRLSLPGRIGPREDNLAAQLGDVPAQMPDLAGAALIREVHVYGQALAVGAEAPGAAQHMGLGTALIGEARRIAAEAGFRRLAVIAAVGTRAYYTARGFERGENYLVMEL